MNQHSTIDEAVFSVEAARGSHAARIKIEFRSRQLQQRNEGVSVAGSWQKNGKKLIRLCKEE
jgi:hypothetical protein